MTLSRMERLKELHRRVRQENEAWKQTINQKTLINATFERIKIFDNGDYFKNKIKAFDKLHETEKPYFDRDHEKKLIPDNMVPNFKKLKDNIFKIKDIVPLVSEQNTTPTQEAEFISPKYAEIANNVKDMQTWFNSNLSSIKSSVASETAFWTNEEKKEHYQDDDEDFIKFNFELNEKLKEYQNKIKSSWKSSKLRVVNKGFILGAFVLVLTTILAIVLLIVYNFS